MVKIYLDTCCFNRPYDDQNLMRNFLEAQAVSHIQFCIQKHLFLLTTSYILLFENSKNPYIIRRDAIEKFIRKYSSIYIGSEKHEVLKEKVCKIMKAGIKTRDAFHVACAEIATCDYFISTDDRLIKCKSENIKIINPIDFLYVEAEI